MDRLGRVLPQTKFCSRKCQSEASRARCKEQRPVCICQHCGKSFQPKAPDRTKYCSRECYFVHKGEAAAKGQSCPISRCRVCGKMVKWNRKACLGECTARYKHIYSMAYERENHEVRACTCSVCGKPFTPKYGDKSRAFCSDECRRVAKNIVRHERGRNHCQRIRHYGGHYEYVKVSSIFERDGWRCRQCGRKTPKRLRGTIALSAPELDHIIPVSAGGDHAPYNLQCLCRACNIKKAAVGSGQLVLV